MVDTGYQNHISLLTGTSFASLTRNYILSEPNLTKPNLFLLESITGAN